MRYHFAKLCLLLAICLFAALSPQGYFEAQASDGPRFRVIYLSQITSRGQRALLLALTTKERVREVQANLRSDPELYRQLRSTRIQINNIVLRRTAMDGSVIYYVR